MKVEFIDNSASQYDENADRIKVPFKSKSKMGKLFLGDSSSASFLQLKSRSCKNVVNCSREMHGFARETDVNYLKIDPDDENVNIFEDSYVFIDSFREKGKNVLVHCENGINKSAAIVLYYLMKKCDMSLGESYKFLKSQRKKEIKIRPQILQQLIAAEKRIRGTISIVLDGRKVVFLDNLKRSTKAGNSISPFYILIGIAVFFAAVFLGIYLLTGKV
mmetsp:Transcript_22141/g.30371  ORF Transcript_22141/g.30371 Transcript_22141/m.30371 type:complete len:218 (-) Transcript_22141:66-719(-)